MACQCALCIRVFPSTQILDGTLPGSHCRVPVCVDVSFLEPARWVAWWGVCLCASVNVGCHYLFLGIGSLSRLRTDVGECLGHLATQLQQLS